MSSRCYRAKAVVWTAWTSAGNARWGIGARCSGWTRKDGARAASTITPVDAAPLTAGHRMGRRCVDPGNAATIRGRPATGPAGAAGHHGSVRPDRWSCRSGQTRRGSDRIAGVVDRDKPVGVYRAEQRAGELAAVVIGDIVGNPVVGGVLALDEGLEETGQIAVAIP